MEQYKIRDFTRKYKSPASLAHRLKNIKDELNNEFLFEIYRASHGRTNLYSFKVKNGETVN